MSQRSPTGRVICMPTSSETRPDLVLLIHGTYAGRKEDGGTSWWQLGSDTDAGLRERLPAGVELAAAGEVFHWSGENSERARIKAAKSLLTQLRGLEREGRGYHLIGHSHGGSVIWHTLRLATLEKVELARLRSWATVGTPYLQNRNRSTTRISNIVRLVLGVILFKPAYVTAVRFCQLLFAPHMSLWAGHVDGQPPKQFSLYETPVLRLLDLMHVSIEYTPDGIQIGGSSYHSGQSMFEFLFLTPVGWLLLFLAIVVIYACLNLGVFFLRPVLESWRLRAEKRLEEQAQKSYGGRWLGLWSPDDEAINGLRATIDLSVSFVSRMAPQDRVLFSDNVALLWQPYFWALTPVFNSLLRPFLDNLVRSYVVKAAQGNNRPGAMVVEVTAVPWSMPEDRHPPSLPDWLSAQLVESANVSAREIAPKLRALLANPSFVSGLESWGTTISGRELVHTSYFLHSEVLDLLAMHVGWARRSPQWPTIGVSARKSELALWLVMSKMRLGAAELIPRTIAPDLVAPLERLVTPRRIRHLHRDTVV